MGGICFFASYYKGPVLPSYVAVYLAELAKEFNRTILLCVDEPDQPSQVFLKERNIEWSKGKNEGYDFGRWYHELQTYDLSTFDRVGLVNDSCVLFSPLKQFWDWSRNESAEVQGMTKSNFRGLHIQSYFMVLKGNAIELARKHFSETGLVTDYQQVITDYELGLSARFLSGGLKLASFLDNGGYEGEFSPYYKCVEYHLRQGMPLIKKRILFADYRKAELFTLARMNFRIDPRRYVKIIKAKHGRLLLDPEVLIEREDTGMSLLQRLRYELTRCTIQFGRPIKRLFRPTRD